MRVLVLHGFMGNSLLKARLLSRRGHTVHLPKLSNWSLKRAIRQAQRACDEFKPDCIVGSSRGGAIALGLKTKAKLILLAPAWRRFNVKPTTDAMNNFNIEIIHGKRDTVIDPMDSVWLAFQLYGHVRLVDDLHPLRGLKGLRGMLEAVHDRIWAI